MQGCNNNPAPKKTPTLATSEALCVPSLACPALYSIYVFYCFPPNLGKKPEFSPPVFDKKQPCFRQNANPFSTKSKPIFDKMQTHFRRSVRRSVRQNANPISTKCKTIFDEMQKPSCFCHFVFDFWPRNFRRNVFCRILLGTFVALLLSPLVGHIWWLLAVGAGVGVCCWLQVLGTFGGLFFCWVLMLAAAGCRWWLLAAGGGCWLQVVDAGCMFLSNIYVCIYIYVMSHFAAGCWCCCCC